MNTCISCYHYIRDTSPFAVHSLAIDDFEKQVDWLLDNFPAVHPADYLAALKMGEEPPKGFMLSFDDGLKEHYEVVFQSLQRRGLSALFFPHVTPTRDGKAPLVNQLQVLIAELDIADLEQRILNRIRTHGGAWAELDAIPEAERTIKRMDKARINHLKYFLNFTLPWSIGRAVVDEVFEDFIGDQQVFVNDMFLTLEQMREMADQGMVFGGHTVSHRYMTSLSAQEQQQEVADSVAYLADTLNTSIESFAYPFGHHNEGARSALERIGVVAGFTTQPEDNVSRENRWHIGRYDTVLLPPVSKFALHELPDLALR